MLETFYPGEYPYAFFTVILRYQEILCNRLVINYFQQRNMQLYLQVMPPIVKWVISKIALYIEFFTVLGLSPIK